MASVGLDTSVVLRLLTGLPEAQARQALDYLDQLRALGDEPHVCDVVVLEAYFALCHHFGLTKAQALDALRALFSTGEIRSTGAAIGALETPNLHSAKPGFADRLTHAHYVDTCGSMATFEHASERLRNVVVLR